MKSLLDKGFIGMDMPPLPDDLWKGIRLLPLTETFVYSTSSETLATWSIPENEPITTQAETGRNGIIRWYDPITGRWLSNDPIGISGGLNQYEFCYNDPINFIDPDGLWGIQIGDVNIGIGDPSLEFNNDSWMDVSQGAAATLDGIIPFADPFASAYTDECGNTKEGTKGSQRLGALSRDIYTGRLITGGLARLGGTRLGNQLLNSNRYLRIGPGRMPANGRFPASPNAPRISIGGPGGPHIDLRP